METERIALSQRERDRLKVLHEVQQKQLTQLAAAEQEAKKRSEVLLQIWQLTREIKATSGPL